MLKFQYIMKKQIAPRKLPTAQHNSPRHAKNRTGAQAPVRFYQQSASQTFEKTQHKENTFIPLVEKGTEKWYTAFNRWDCVRGARDTEDAGNG